MTRIKQSLQTLSEAPRPGWQVMVSGLLLGLLLMSASLACQAVTQLAVDPTLSGPTMPPPPGPTSNEEPRPVCTPPLCAPDQVYYCPDECPGGCGTICVIPTPEPPTAEPLTAEPPTPASSEKPTAVASPTITELTVPCEREAWGWFEGALQMVSGVREQIGCPTQEHLSLTAASQDFQYGYMLWREDEQLVYVLYDAGGWESYPDLWQEGMLEQDPSFGPPPEGLIQPKRGFGLVWQEYPAARDRLGWAFNEERLCDDAHSQTFERGFMLECTQDIVPRAKIRVFILFHDQTYTIYSPP